jgi:hypothetical protein
MEAIRSSETSVQSTTSTRRHTPEDGILHGKMYFFGGKYCFHQRKQVAEGESNNGVNGSVFYGKLTVSQLFEYFPIFYGIRNAFTINIYQFNRQRKNCLLTYVALHVSTLIGHSQVRHVSHTQWIRALQFSGWVCETWSIWWWPVRVETCSASDVKKQLRWQLNWYILTVFTQQDANFEKDIVYYLR